MFDLVVSTVNLFQLVSIETIKDAIVSLAAVSTAIIAFLGLRIWRKQLKGQAQYELARRLMRAVYKVRENIRIVRNPFLPLEQKDQLSKGITKVISDLNAARLEAEFLWDAEINEILKPLHKLVKDLFRGITLSLDYKGEKLHFELYEAEAKEIHDTIYETNEDPEKDAFAVKVQNAIKEVEKYVRSHLEI